MDQKVFSSAPTIVEWLDCYASLVQDRAAQHRVVPCSYAVLQRRFQRAATFLGFGAIHWTTHSLRRGAATSMLQQRVPLADIMLRGRWLSERSAREYLRRVDVAIMRLRQDIEPLAWRWAGALAALGPMVWAYVLEPTNQ